MAVIKLGAQGAFYATAQGGEHVAPFPVAAVDSVAAGDAFNGALAVALLSGKTLREAARYACAASALSVTRPGAQPSMPTRAAVNSFLRRNR